MQPASITWMPGVFSPRANPEYQSQLNAFNSQRASIEARRQKGLADLDATSIQEQAQMSERNNDAWRRMALQTGRRRAGGSGFRQRGTVMPQLTGLQKANSGALKEARRRSVMADYDSQLAAVRAPDAPAELPPLVSPNLFWMNT